MYPEIRMTCSQETEHSEVKQESWDNWKSFDRKREKCLVAHVHGKQFLGIDVFLA